ncbi:olfactory receptor 52N4-like [Hemicordylus capensis]|uniref:olfactory receptor 52N4-like n=1 Tax=Hemicordylus capensis TaxID=884348 RepID=UPI0023030184|nr:olfactory receptor 52N4-like [Hemicordylus capensis]
MTTPNDTGNTLQQFILNGIPGLEHAHIWISFPFFSMYLIGMVGNCGLLYIIWTEEALHRPMYYFLSMLSMTDIVMGTSTMPKAFCIFWLDVKEIGFKSCLVQMYFVHTFTGMESGVLMLMALDRFLAICYPLRYATILTNPIIVKVAMVTFLRGAVLILPFPFLVRKLRYCGTNIIAHTFCDHMSVVKLSCSSIHLDAIYGLAVALLIGGFDVFCITVSYFMILKAVVGLSSKEARSKAFGTCTAHICAITVSYKPAFFTFFAHRFGRHNVAPHVHIIMANLYLLLPPMMNPIVYGVKTKEIHESVLRLFHGGKVIVTHSH